MSRAYFQLACLGLVATACGRIGFAPIEADAAASACGPWGSVQRQVALATSADDWDPALSPDGLTLVFGSKRDSTNSHLFVATRGSVADLFGTVRAAMELGVGGPTSFEVGPSWSSDGGYLYFASDGAARSARYLGDGLFGMPAEVDLPTGYSWVMTDDELEVFYSYDNDGEIDLRHATRATATQPWTVLTDVAAMNRVGFEDGWPGFDEPRQALYVEREVTGGAEIRMATRAAPGTSFGPLEPVDLGGEAGDPDISRDGTTMVFSSLRAGGAGAYDVYTATRACE